MTEPASLMMVTYNRLPLTQKTLESLFETTEYPFSLVIIDNASTDGTVEYLQSFLDKKLAENLPFFKSYSLQVNKKNLGIGIGRNQALLAAKGEWLVTLDNDVILPRHWLNECIEILSTNEDVGMCGVNFEKEEFPIVTRHGRIFQLRPVGNLGTACIVFNKRLYQELGFFNTEYGLYGEEDADFGYRARVKGYELGYLQEAGIHLGVGANDTGKYKEFKENRHKKNVLRFKTNCFLYKRGLKNIYIHSPGFK